MAEIRNEFSWSKSRDEVFMTCPRQYYFNYYGYWGGWKATAPQRTWQVYMLKNLKNRFAYFHRFCVGISVDNRYFRIAFIRTHMVVDKF